MPPGWGFWQKVAIPSESGLFACFLKVKKVTKVRIMAILAILTLSAPFQNMGRLGLRSVKSGPKSDGIAKVTEWQESPKVTKVRKVTKWRLCAESLFLRSPTQAKVSRHFYARSVTLRHFCRNYRSLTLCPGGNKVSFTPPSGPLSG